MPTRLPRSTRIEWSDPLGLRGCGFFPLSCAAARPFAICCYWDKLTFLKIQGRALPE
ncbi:MAG: hypothetical protein ABIT01_20510 [Thermoanaerobaculia bacterium]